MPKCAAKAKSTGKRCKNDAMPGMRVCGIHGGKTPKGEASPHFKHGKFSKYMPERLKQRFEEAEQDTQTGILQRNISIRDALLVDRLKSLDGLPDSSKAWETMRKLIDDQKKAFKNEDYGAVVLSYEEIDRLIDDAMLMHHAIADINDLMKEQRNDEKAIADIQYKGENAIPARELMTLMGGVLAVIQSVITNKDQRVQIAHGINQLMERNTSAIAAE